MKKTLYTPLLTAALLLAASCANDPAEEILNPSVPGTHLPGDTFIIDYAASTGEADTRGLSAAERIQSLDYLVYQSTDGGTTYTLLKRRAIPDINTHTTWPLTRKTMTWAQREALKDTLNTSCMYKMVFVANAADWIWEKENATPPSNDALENSSDIVLQHANLPTDGTEAPKFEDGRLILPPRVFTEKDMYYMETVEIEGKNYTGEKTAHQNVLLKRMINKVEVKLDEEVVRGIRENDKNVDKYIENVLGNYYDEHYVNASFSNEEEMGILDSVVNYYMNTKAASIKVPYMGVDKEKACKEAFVELLNENTNKKAVIESINICSNEYSDDAQCCVKHQFISEAKKDIDITSICNWSLVKQLQLNYDANSYPYAIDFNKVTKTNIDATNSEHIIAYPIEKEGTTITDNIDNRYIFYTFGNNAGESINTIQSVTLIYKDENTPSFEMLWNVKPGNEITEGNQFILLICNPINVITASSTHFTFVDNDFKLHNAINWDWDTAFPYSTIPYGGWYKSNMIQWVNEQFNAEQSNNDNIEYKLSLDIPEVRITSPWKTGLKAELSNE